MAGEAVSPGHKVPDVEEFDEDLLPEPLREWVFDVAKRMDNAAPDFTAAAAVVQAAALIGRKVGIYPKRHDDWMVIPNLWGSLVGPPASMKTPPWSKPSSPPRGWRPGRLGITRKPSSNTSSTRWWRPPRRALSRSNWRTSQEGRCGRRPSLRNGCHQEKIEAPQGAG